MNNRKLALLSLTVLGILVILFFGSTVIRNSSSSKPEFDFSGITRPTTYKESPKRGIGSSNLVIYEFADFNCPGCKTMQNTMNQVILKYGDKVTHVWKDFPFLSNDSKDAAVAARCANEQDLFWEYHDWLYNNQGIVSSLGSVSYWEADVDPDFNYDFDKKRFTQCMGDDTISNLVDRDFAEARALGIDQTPTLVIGNIALVGVQEFGDIEQIIISQLQE